MAGFLPEARFLDLIVALVALEALVLVGTRILVGYGPSIVGTLANCSAGACLLLALRAAMIGAAFPALVSLLGVSLVAHLADLAARWTADSHKETRSRPPVLIQKKKRRGLGAKPPGR